MTNIETRLDAIDDVAQTVNKIWKGLKAGIPSILIAAITSGLVNGHWGAFLYALFTGHAIPTH